MAFFYLYKVFNFSQPTSGFSYVLVLVNYKHYYAKYAELEDMKYIGVQEVVLVSETTEVEE